MAVNTVGTAVCNYCGHILPEQPLIRKRRVRTIFSKDDAIKINPFELQPGEEELGEFLPAKGLRRHVFYRNTMINLISSMTATVSVILGLLYLPSEYVVIYAIVYFSISLVIAFVGSNHTAKRLFNYSRYIVTNRRVMIFQSLGLMKPRLIEIGALFGSRIHQSNYYRKHGFATLVLQKTTTSKKLEIERIEPEERTIDPSEFHSLISNEVIMRKKKRKYDWSAMSSKDKFSFLTFDDAKKAQELILKTINLSNGTKGSDKTVVTN